MEVYSLSDLYFTIPISTTGLIEYSGNTIPIQLNIGTGGLFSPDVLTLNSDNISSGRRRIGMLVYVIDEDQIYQYQIPNFDSLWSGATGATGPGGPTVVFSDFGTTVKSNTPQGIAFISAWTSNIIEGVSGGTSINSVWKKLVTGGSTFTGGTVTGDTIFTQGLTATTISASTYLGLPLDVYVTGGTYSAGTAYFTNNSGTTFTVNGFYTGDTDNNTFVTGFTYSANTFTIKDNSGSTFNATINDVTGLTVNGTLSATTISGGTLYGDGTNLSNIVNSLTTFTGLSANTTTGNITILNTAPDQVVTISGGTGILTGGTYPNFEITNTLPDQIVTITGGDGMSVSGTYPNFTVSNTGETYVTGFTYSANTFTISDNSGSTFNATINEMTGLTVNGTLSATTISANTIGNVQYIDFDTTNTGTTSSPGRLFWDVNNRTLSLGMISGVTQQIGEEQYYLVENQTGNPLSDGTVVRAIGTTGSSGKLLIDYMIADGTIPAFTTLGVLTQPLNDGETGYVTNFGLVRNIDTTGTPYGETWGNGTILYVSPTILGGFTSVKPITPNQDIIIAIVMEAAVSGSIFIRPDIYRPFKDPQRITVAKQNGDFTSVKDAVDSITGSSSSNRYVIDIGPGEFYEGEIDMTNTPYVSLVGSNIQTTLLIPTGSTQHILKIGINNEVSFLSFSGVGSGYAAIYCYDIGDFGQAHKCSFYDCDTNLWVISDTQDTKFYGEYLDYNGDYTYGTRVEANNGYLALANMENYFNFPTGSNIVYCNWASGSGATISVFVGDCQSNGVSGSTAYYIQDSSELNASTITVDGFTYGIRNPNIGNPIRFDVDNASLVNGEWDLYVERIGTFGTFGGSSSHNKIYSLSEDVYWLFLDIQDGELDITRKASVTFADGSHTDLSTLVFEGGSMGLFSGGNLTTISGTTIQADQGFGYLEKSDNSGIVRRIDWSGTQITLSSNTNNYIYINENSILSSSGSRPDTKFNILLGRVVTNSTDVEFIDLSPFNGEHTSNRYGDLLAEALGPIYAFGSIVTEGTSSFTLDVTAGEYYYATNEFLPSGGTPITFTQYYRNGTGATWITSATTLVNNTQYDNNGTLTGLTTSAFTKHTLYLVGDGTYENYFLVLGQNEYMSLVQAEDALLPTPPTYFSDSVVQIANIYIQQGATGITQVEDIRPVIGFRAGGVNASSVHANLLGLSSDDHIQYLLVNGGRAMSGNLDMGGNNIVSAGTINSVTIQSHASRHQFGGLDQVGTTTPTPNGIPYADVSGKLDSWISTATTSTLGLVTLSTSPVSPSTPIVVGENDTRFQNSFTGASFNDSTDTLTLNRINGTSVSVTGLTDYFVTGFTYDNANTITLSQNNGQSSGVTLNTFTGLTINGTLSATTISGGTLYGDGTNLSNVVNSLTTSTGLSANTTTGNITILNTSPDQTVTISGGTGILTGGTYPNFEITNTLPDQTVTISGGTGILTGGTYPNFEITNTAPDQTVTISGGTGILTGGTYPNFEITNTAPDQVVTISDGGGMSITGSYPSFTISNTGETYVTGVTYSANTLTVSQNGGVSPINTTVGLKIKSGVVLAGSFAGSPRIATVTFTTPYANTNYSISITGGNNRTYTYQTKTINGFVINTNANTVLTADVTWSTIESGES